jgi:hypothetical protein
MTQPGSHRNPRDPTRHRRLPGCENRAGLLAIRMPLSFSREVAQEPAALGGAHARDDEWSSSQADLPEAASDHSLVVVKQH